MNLQTALQYREMTNRTSNLQVAEAELCLLASAAAVVSIGLVMQRQAQGPPLAVAYSKGYESRQVIAEGDLIVLRSLNCSNLPDVIRQLSNYGLQTQHKLAKWTRQRRHAMSSSTILIHHLGGHSRPNYADLVFVSGGLTF